MGQIAKVFVSTVKIMAVGAIFSAHRDPTIDICIIIPFHLNQLTAVSVQGQVDGKKPRWKQQYTTENEVKVIW